MCTLYAFNFLSYIYLPTLNADANAKQLITTFCMGVGQSKAEDGTNWVNNLWERGRHLIRYNSEIQILQNGHWLATQALLFKNLQDLLGC